MICDYPDNAFRYGVHLHLRKSDKFYIVVMQPMFPFSEMFPIHLFVCLDSVGDPFSLYF